MLRRLFALVAVAMCVALFGVACRSATQIEVRVSTDVPCAIVAERHTSFFSGDPATEAPYASTGDCTTASPLNEVGTIVLAPSEGSDVALDVSFVVGVNARSEECVSQGYKGCIRARRRVRFVPHEGLRMPIELSLSCLDKVCEPDQTCFRGSCVSPDVIALGGCIGPECAAPPAVAVDPSAPDATVTDAIASDAASDAGIDVTSDAAAVEVELFEATANDMPRGLAIDRGFIHWSQGAGPGQSMIRTKNLTTGAQGALTQPLSGDVHGIAVSGLVLAYANLTNGGFAIVNGTETPFPGNGANYFGAGILGANDYVFASAKDLLRTTGGGALALAQYIEVDGLTVGFASLGSVGVWTAGASDPPTSIPIGDGTLMMRGLAMAANHWIVSTEDLNDIYAVQRTTHNVTVLSTKDFEDIEDLAWDEGAKVLYVAGKTPLGMGIYRMHNLAPLFPQ